MSWPVRTRSQIMAMAYTGFGTGLGKVPYSQDTIVNGYRADCSGFVSRCLGLTSAVGHGFWGGLNTETLLSSGALLPIDINNLTAGDLAGEMGPGTGGDSGHVYVFDRWYNTDPNDNRMYLYEQYGGSVGPQHTLRVWPYPDVCRAYRYAGLVTTPVPIPYPNDRIEPMFLANVSGQTAMYLVYADGTARHILDELTFQSLRVHLGNPVPFTSRDFNALLKVS